LTKAALRDWAVVPDTSSNIDTEDELRRSLFDALFENRVFVAERKVPRTRCVTKQGLHPAAARHPGRDSARQRPALAAQAAPRRIHLCAGRMRSRSTSWRFSTASSGGFAVRRTPNAVRAAKRSSRANSQPARTAARTFPSSPRFADRSQQRPPLVAQAPPRRRRSGGSLDQLSAYRSGEETGARFEIQRLLRISPIATCSTQTVIPRRACQRRT
jgi:hypothetical protein